MAQRSWPWKKKASEKITILTEADVAASAAPAAKLKDAISQDVPKPVVKYVQLTEERYAHLSGLEDEVKFLNEKLEIELDSLNEKLEASQSEVQILNEKLEVSQEEVITKENLVNQHMKVAEEAVSGWEKAEAEASALKVQLESVTLLKLTAEERSAHLDGALKECMTQIRIVKEESEQRLHDVIFAKTQQWEAIQYDFEDRINQYEQELLKSAAANDALSRSLQERSNQIMKISEEKSAAEAEIEILRTNIQSCEKEINSLKYEHHIVSKELEIRNEEKNMCARSAEVANKQHLEDVKKITKLEAECQRLRTLVRKKLPGPAALAQMRLEVDGLGRDSGETRVRKSPVKGANLSPSSPSDVPLEIYQKEKEHYLKESEHYQKENEHFKKENELLSNRLLAIEEETKMLKEALSKRNNELQASRSTLAKTSSQLRSLEAQISVLNRQNSPSKSSQDILIEGLLRNDDRNAPTSTPNLEDSESSCSGSSTTIMASEHSQINKEKDTDKSSLTANSNHIELMDDFLEMEKLACLPDESKGGKSVLSEGTSPIANVRQSDGQSRTSSDPYELVISKLQSQVASLFNSQPKEANLEKVIEGLKCILQDIQADLPQKHGTTDSINVTEDISGTVERVISATTVCTSMDTKPSVSADSSVAISKIQDFVVSLLGSPHIHMVDDFFSAVDKAKSSELSLDDFIIILASTLCEIKELDSRSFCNNNETESVSSDFVDKATLLENKAPAHNHELDGFVEHSVHRLPQESHSLDSLGRCSPEDYEQLQEEKNGLATELMRCNETLEETKGQLLEASQQMENLKSELAACRNSHSLLETQLKCMAESYRLLESRSHDLESEINLLRAKAELLDNELHDEKCAHEEDLLKYKDLQQQIERSQRCSVCSHSLETDGVMKTKQENEIAAAAEKLAECQQTIFLLGKQLKSFRPQVDLSSHHPNERHTLIDHFSDDGYQSNLNFAQQLDYNDTDNTISNLRKRGEEHASDRFSLDFSPTEVDGYEVPVSPPTLKPPKHRSSRSSSSFSSSSEEKHGRGFTRFFSKGSK